MHRRFRVSASMVIDAFEQLHPQGYFPRRRGWLGKSFEKGPDGTETPVFLVDPLVAIAISKGLTTFETVFEKQFLVDMYQYIADLLGATQTYITFFVLGVDGTPPLQLGEKDPKLVEDALNGYWDGVMVYHLITYLSKAKGWNYPCEDRKVVRKWKERRG